MFYRELPSDTVDVREIQLLPVPWDRFTRPEDLTPHERLRRAKFNARHNQRPHFQKHLDSQVADLRREVRRGPTRMQAIVARQHRACPPGGYGEWLYNNHPYLRGWI